MEFPDRRLKYSLLGQIPDEPPQVLKYWAGIGGAVAQQRYCYGNRSGEGSQLDSWRAAYDWDMIDQRLIQAEQSRIGATADLRSFGQASECSIASDSYVPPVLDTERSVAGELMVETREDFGGVGGGSSRKTWAQQAVESYQLQLALALRLSSGVARGSDPNFLDLVLDESASRVASSPGSADAVSHRFWVNGSLSYSEKVPPGFYSIHGMDPYVWAVCSDSKESGLIPSLESLKIIEPAIVSSVEVISVDQQADSNLKELQNQVLAVSFTCMTTQEVVDQLAKLVCNHMGGLASGGEDQLVTIWKQCSDELKACSGSIVLPIGSLPVGLCRHRSLLFKALADVIGLPCRIAKGCRYCSRQDASSCLVRFSVDREYLIDLIEKPGCLCEPDSLLNGLSTISISSPLHFAQFKQVEHTVDYKLLANEYLLNFQSLDVMFDNSLAGGTVVNGDTGNSMYPEQPDRAYKGRTGPIPCSSNQGEIPLVSPFAKVHYNEPLPLKPSHAWDVTYAQGIAKGSVPLKLVPPIMHRDVQPLIDLVDPREHANRDKRFGEGAFVVPYEPSIELAFNVEDMNICWSDLVLRERIGSGSFGTVHRAEWNDCDVAVKILMEQEFDAERLNEFLREVAIMKRLRHPNIVLFMGAVTEPPNLSIVTEYLSRGSLYRLLQKPGVREILDERRRLSMAYDVAKGMNYLHRCNPPIVHRDLKSPNLLVDDKYTVKVCDFGLSRLKENTFLSSKSAAGTPEWMAPEVLCNERSNEKSDVYSFGVILWELVTLQKPWANLNPPQVVAAVGFKGKRLEIPHSVNPYVAAIIEACWANEPWKRPSFSSVMEALRPLIESSPTSQPGRAEMPLLI